mmetsp:Transcript_64512/g.120036  ORF Transcript_64512/g.120036 Transcript_64512/m.120036 type:complete len:298 (+) Transcript_64512:177-1070(+)
MLNMQVVLSTMVMISSLPTSKAIECQLPADWKCHDECSKAASGVSLPWQVKYAQPHCNAHILIELMSSGVGSLSLTSLSDSPWACGTRTFEDHRAKGRMAPTQLHLTIESATPKLVDTHVVKGVTVHKEYVRSIAEVLPQCIRWKPIDTDDRVMHVDPTTKPQAKHLRGGANEGTRIKGKIQTALEHVNDSMNWCLLGRYWAQLHPRRARVVKASGVLRSKLLLRRDASCVRLQQRSLSCLDRRCNGSCCQQFWVERNFLFVHQVRSLFCQSVPDGDGHVWRGLYSQHTVQNRDQKS